MAGTIYLSVIVPVRNEEKHICQTLEDLSRQEYPEDRYEIIVVDGRSTDRTREVVEDFIRKHDHLAICLLDNPGVLSSSGRNIGIRAARGRLIAVIDGHVHIPNAGLFAAMERAKESHHVLCLSRPAPLLPPAIEKGTAFWIAAARKCWLAHSRTSYIFSSYEGLVDPVSSGFAYDRSVFERVGYFDEVFDAAEDVEFHHRLRRAGILAYTSPVLTIYSYPRESLLALFRQMTRYGVGRARCLRKHSDSFTWELLIPPAIFLFFLSWPLAVLSALSIRWLGVIYAALFVFYWLLVVGTGLVESVKRGRLLPGVLVATAIWTIHIGLGYGFVRAMLRPRLQPPPTISFTRVPTLTSPAPSAPERACCRGCSGPAAAPPSH